MLNIPYRDLKCDVFFSSWGLGYQSDEDVIKLLDLARISVYDGTSYGLVIIKENNRVIERGDPRFDSQQQSICRTKAEILVLITKAKWRVVRMTKNEITFGENGTGSHMYCITPIPDDVCVDIECKAEHKLIRLHRFENYDWLDKKEAIKKAFISYRPITDAELVDFQKTRMHAMEHNLDAKTNECSMLRDRIRVKAKDITELRHRLDDKDDTIKALEDKLSKNPGGK